MAKGIELLSETKRILKKLENLSLEERCAILTEYISAHKHQEQYGMLDDVKYILHYFTDNIPGSEEPLFREGVTEYRNLLNQALKSIDKD